LMSYYLDYYTLNIPKVLLNLFIIPLERGKWADWRRIDPTGAVKHLELFQQQKKSNWWVGKTR
jgi:hypothetical protein